MAPITFLLGSAALENGIVYEYSFYLMKIGNDGGKAPNIDTSDVKDYILQWKTSERLYLMDESFSLYDTLLWVYFFM